MKITITLAVLIYLLFGCSSVDENKITIITDGNGTYTCMFGSTMSMSDYGSYEEAKDHCYAWCDKYNQALSRKNKNWKPISR